MWAWLRQYNSVACSHVGHVRQRNEDSLLADDKKGLWLVADGMGGHAGGDVASQLACEVVVSCVNQRATLADAIAQAHQRILEKSAATTELAGMGTTLVAAQRQGNGCLLAWVGDSRIYLWRSGELTQLSTDHSFVQDLVFRGVLTKEEAGSHPQKNLINQALGQVNLKRLKIDTLFVKLKPEDQLLLCTDGLHDMLAETELMRCFQSADSAEQLRDLLIQSVLTTQASDNFSFIVVKVKRLSLLDKLSI